MVERVERDHGRERGSEEQEESNRRGRNLDKNW